MIETLLVRMPNWLGDCVMALPAVKALRSAFPEARLLLAARKGFVGFLSDQTGVDGVAPCPGGGVSGFLQSLGHAPAAGVAAAGTTGIGGGVLFTNSLSTAVWLWRAGAKRRIGYDLNGRGVFLTDPVPWTAGSEKLHMTEMYLHLSRSAASRFGASAGDGVRDDGPPFPEAAVGARGVAAGEAVRARFGVEGKYAVLAPASAYGPVKDWPPEYYAELAGWIAGGLGWPVFLAGTGGQRDVCGRIAGQSPRVHNVAGETGLDAFLGLLAGAGLFVGGDSGGAHAAAALGVPTLVIFGITEPGRTRPLGGRVAMLGKGEKGRLRLSSEETRKRAAAALRAVAPADARAAAEKLLAGEADP